MVSLPSNHMVKALLDCYYLNALNLHHIFLEKLSSKQRLKVKIFIIDTNNCLNRIISSLNPLHKELTPRFWLVNTFSNCFLFNIAECKVNDYKNIHLQKLNDIFIDFLQNSKTVVIISDASTKNNVTMSIAHVYSSQNIVAKTIYHAVNVTSTEVELFAIRYGINQAIQVTDVLYIIVVADAIYLMRYIFNLLTHSYQI